MILIVAYQEAQARGTADRLGLTRDQWKYLRDERDLHGTRGISILVVDTSWRRHDYHRLETMFRACDAFVWYETDYARERHDRECSAEMPPLPPQQKPRKV